jgi:hypothetical protein
LEEELVAVKIISAFICRTNENHEEIMMAAH